MEEDPPMIDGGSNKVEFPLTSSHSHSPTFEIEGAPPHQSGVTSGGGIEMVAASYTSLRDIIPHPNPNNDSWNEIPIKNHLLKQAALAYLQPMSTPRPEVGDKGFLQKLKENCFSEFGCCFRWLHGEVFSTFFGNFVGFFCGRRRLKNEDQQREEEDDDDNVD